MELTKKQKKILAIARNIGHISKKQVSEIYAKSESRKNAIYRLIDYGLIKAEFGNFIYQQDKDDLGLSLLKGEVF
jgi:hypothetical protein